MSAAGVPSESRDAWYSQCGWDARQPPQPLQAGGDCGCMAGAPLQGQQGGGSGNGGYAVQLSNDLVKMVAGYNVAPCGPAPVAKPLVGGAAADEYGVVSYKTGYGMGPDGVVSTPSAHYLDPSRYERTMSGGRKSRKSRKQRA